MLMQQTKDQLRTLRLSGFLVALEQQLEQPQSHDLSFEQRISLLVERELLHRENRRLERLLRQAKLRVSASVEDVNYSHKRGLDKSRMASLASGEWISNHLNLCITAPTGLGS